jgi:putative oxidoreductase
MNAAARLEARLRPHLACLQRLGEPVILLGLRLMMAKIFFQSGQVKLLDFTTTIDLFRDEYKTPLLPPELAATLATATELTMPVLLLLGLATRLAALPLLAMTLMIQFTYLDRDEHYLWMLTFTLLAVRGAGSLSLDHLITRRLRPR